MVFKNGAGLLIPAPAYHPKCTKLLNEKIKNSKFMKRRYMGINTGGHRSYSSRQL